MKENVFDVLIYLFENYMDGEVELSPDSDKVKSLKRSNGLIH